MVYSLQLFNSILCGCNLLVPGISEPGKSDIRYIKEKLKYVI